MKDPAFLFYSSDFLTGVSTMNFEDRGKYITILATMHQKGRLDEETIRFLVGLPSVMLSSKFLKDGDGLWYNERLDKEINKRKGFIDSRRENGKLGGRPPKPNGKPLAKPIGYPLGGATDNLLENENEDTVLVITKSKEDKAYTPELVEGFSKFNSWIKSNAANVLKMKEPFTIDEYDRIKQEFKVPDIQAVLQAMHNHAQLLKKYTSANLTFRTFMRNQLKGKETVSDVLPPPKREVFTVKDETDD